MKKFYILFVLLFPCFFNLFAQKIDVYKRPFQVERSREYDAKHYRIQLTFDFDEKKFWGENKITLSPLQDNFTKCVLDAEELVVTEVLNNRNIPLRFSQTDKQVVIHLSRAYSYSEPVIFTVKYYAIDPKLGLFFVDKSPTNPQMVGSGSWPNRARHWFPCYDSPNDKVTHEAIVTVKNNYKVLSNGRLVSVKENKNEGTVTYHWSQDLPNATYLTMMSIAPFAVIQDSLGSLPINYWVYPKDTVEAKWNFRRTPQIIDFFNKLYGYDYPWAKYDQVVDPRQGGGAEATSATILGEGVIYDRRAEQDFSWDRIIAHEAAHQWWGDLITLRTWAHTWMNESFGTYSDYLFTRSDKGEDEGAVDLMGKKNQYLREAHNRYMRPIVFHRYNKPGDNFDSHTYPKGASVLHMLRFILGDEPFFRTLQYFLHKHEFQAVDTHDFMIAVKEVTGKNMDWFFEQFIFKPGHMVLDVSTTWNERAKTVQMKVIQTQDTSLGIPIYKIPVRIGITTSEQKISRKLWIKDKEETFEFSVNEKPLLVRFDEGNYLLKEWTFTKEIDELLYQLKNDDVIGKMWAASELVKFDGTPCVAEELTECMQTDPFWAVRKSAVEALSKLKVKLDINLLKKLCKDENSKVRTSSLRILGDTKDGKLISFFKDQFKKDDSYVAQAEVLRSIGKCGNNSQISFLKNAAKMKSPRNVIKRAADWAINEIGK
jgi:aminopeptidase N